MTIALILTICTPLLSGGEQCDSQVVKLFDNVNDCLVAMDENRRTDDYSYLSCGKGE